MAINVEEMAVMLANSTDALEDAFFELKHEMGVIQRRIDILGSIIEDNKKVIAEVTGRPYGWSLWKCGNGTYDILYRGEIEYCNIGHSEEEAWEYLNKRLKK